MARIHKLSARFVQTVKKPGYFNDGGGLYLRVKPSLAKSWVFRYRDRRTKRLREMGLGPVHTISLAEAREQALQARKALYYGRDPIAERRARSQSPSFAELAEQYFEAHRAAWGEVHAQDWIGSLRSHALPVIGALPVNAIGLEDVLRVLKPIWEGHPVLASRVRQRIEAVLAWATVRGHRQGDNPARWSNNLDKLLPPPSRLRAVRHHPALPYGFMPEFMAELRSRQGQAARALEFLILTAARAGEVRAARWEEIDFEERCWTVPAARMKAGREHCVPLSEQALALLRRLPRFLNCAFIFTNGTGPLAKSALRQALQDINSGTQPRWTDRHGESITVHGFRSTFRDWAGETTEFAREVIEHALAHRIPDATEAAYARGTLYNKRAALMQAWADYLDGRAEAPHTLQATA